MKQLCSIWINTFGKCFFFPTRASNSADVDGDYVVDGDDNVGDTDGDE